MPEEPILSKQEAAWLVSIILEALDAIEDGEELPDSWPPLMQMWVDLILNRIWNTEGDA